MCDAPLYTAYCVTGFFASINHDFSPCVYHEGDIDPPWLGPNCNVAVKEKSWSGVKELFR